MALSDMFKISWKTFFNPVAWLDFRFLKEQNKTIVEVLKTSFTPDKPLHKESFTEALSRLGVTEEEVQALRMTYIRYALLFATLGLVVFLYAFFLIFRHGTITGWLLGLIASAMFFTQAFKYDFWALQIERRHLGLTFQDWKNHILGTQDKPNG
jgi:intracellular multiplication protein IcmV